jgi:fucose permease
LIMAIAGGALIPLVFGKLAQIMEDMQSAYLVGIVCYFVILMYALKWHKMSAWSK